MPERQRLGSSGLFKAIVDGARKFKRALSEDGTALTPEAEEQGQAIGQAFVVGRFADVHAMTIASLQEKTSLEQFEAGWVEAVTGRGPFTGFEITSVGSIDVGFIPGLEEVPQEQFVAFLEITFSSPEVPLDDEQAFTVGAVLLDDAGKIRLGAIHTR